jgi:hypothetical protein
MKRKLFNRIEQTIELKRHDSVIPIEVACPFCANPKESRLPVTCDVLDEFECGTPGCDCTVIAIAQQCHPDADQRPFYCKKHGTLSLFCSICGELGCVVLVASAPYTFMEKQEVQ